MSPHGIHTGNLSGTLALSGPLVPQDCTSPGGCILRRWDTAGPGSLERTPLVASPHGGVEWESNQASIDSDACNYGWGAHCEGFSTRVLWTPQERKLHINALELLAGSFAIKSFAKDKVSYCIRLRMDNVSGQVRKSPGWHQILRFDKVIFFPSLIPSVAIRSRGVSFQLLSTFGVDGLFLLLAEFL